MTRQSQYPPELPERAARMVAEVTPTTTRSGPRSTRSRRSCGIGTAETVRKWVRQAESDAGQRLGTSTEESAARTLEREVAELRRANEILKRCPAFFASVPR